MSEIKQIGNYRQGGAWNNPQTGRVYSPDGISPALNTCGGGDREVKIIEPIICIGGLQEHQTPRTDGISPSLTAAMGMGGGQTPMIVASRGRNPQNPSDRTPGNHVEQRLEPNSQGICNTLASVQKDNLVLEPKGLKFVGGLGEKDWAEDGKKLSRNYPQGERVYDAKGIACSQTAQGGGTGSYTGLYLHEYRIRKLTPRECWRLMDFTDEDFEKAEAVNSNTQLYKQAGNSIVKAVLMAIFKQIL